MLNDDHKISSQHIYPSISIAQSCEVLMKKCRSLELNINLISSSSLLHHFQVIVSVLSNEPSIRSYKEVLYGIHPINVITTTHLSIITRHSQAFPVAAEANVESTYHPHVC